MAAVGPAGPAACPAGPAACPAGPASTWAARRFGWVGFPGGSTSLRLDVWAASCVSRMDRRASCECEASVSLMTVCVNPACTARIFSSWTSDTSLFLIAACAMRSTCRWKTATAVSDS